MPRPRSWQLDTLWCSNQRSRAGNGWAFPPNVRKHLIALCAGLSVVHLFGGQADFGLRLDIDSALQPNVIGDAWLPPFKRDAFDVVILDPPYHHINQQMKQQLFAGSAWIARKWVIWFHTMWVASGSGLHPERAWMVRVGDTCAVRALQVFSVGSGKRLPAPFFSRGPQVRYNRWLGGQQRFALEGKPTSVLP